MCLWNRLYTFAIGKEKELKKDMILTRKRAWYRFSTSSRHFKITLCSFKLVQMSNYFHCAKTDANFDVLNSHSNIHLDKHQTLYFQIASNGMLIALWNRTYEEKNKLEKSVIKPRNNRTQGWRKLWKKNCFILEVDLNTLVLHKMNMPHSCHHLWQLIRA